MDKAGASENPLVRKDDALFVIIDMQERLLPVISNRETIVLNTVRLVRFARIADIPVLVTEQKNLGRTTRKIREHLPDLQPIEKLAFNGFGSPEFADKVRQTGRHTLIIAGVEAHICVAQTALSAMSTYGVHVVSDAISSRSPHNHEVAVQRMLGNGVTITSTEMVIYELLEQAGTAAFKETLPLVK